MAVAVAVPSSILQPHRRDPQSLFRTTVSKPHIIPIMMPLRQIGISCAFPAIAVAGGHFLLPTSSAPSRFELSEVEFSTRAADAEEGGDAAVESLEILMESLLFSKRVRSERIF